MSKYSVVLFHIHVLLVSLPLLPFLLPFLALSLPSILPHSFFFLILTHLFLIKFVSKQLCLLL